MAQRLIPLILERGVEYHCRRGIRQWCYCSFCNEKRSATRFVATAGQTVLFLMQVPNVGCGVYDFERKNWEIYVRIQRLRRRAIDKVRVALKERREE